MEVEIMPAGAQQVIAYVRAAGEAHLISASDAELLNRCDSFADLDEHAESIGGSLMLDRSDFDQIKRRLAGLADKGLMISISAAESAAAHPSAASRKSNLASLVMVTCDRVETARRGLASYMACAEKFDRKKSFVLLDDSSTPETRASYREMCGSLGKERDSSMFYAGFEEKKSFARELFEKGFPRHVVDFALFGEPGYGPIYGANNNAELLDSVGEAVWSVDDDTICKIARAPDFEEGLDLCSKHDPTVFHFYRKREEAWEDAQYQDVDPFELHEKLLGAALPDCVARHGGYDELGLDEAGARLVEALRAGTGKVAVSSLGMAGDSGMGSTRYYLFQRGENRERLVGSHHDYEELINTRNVLRAVRRTSVSEGTFLMFCSAAVDATDLLPPVFPIGRNNDGQFAVTLRTVSPRSYIGHLPWMITHDPPGERASSKEANLFHGSRFRLMDFVIAGVMSFKPSGGEARVADRIRDLGRHLIWLGTLDVKDFEDFVHRDFLAQLGRSVTRLEESLEFYDGSPSWWADDIEEYMEAILKAIPKREIVFPAELDNVCGLEEALGRAQRLIAQYGELAALWPDIWDAAKNLKESGRRLASRV